MLSDPIQQKGHFIDVSDNIYKCHCFLRSGIFRNVSDSASSFPISGNKDHKLNDFLFVSYFPYHQAFYSFEKQLFTGFSEVFEKLPEQNSVINYIKKQPSRGVLRKRCSGNMQQIYGRKPMPKFNFNKVSNNTSGRLFLYVVINVGGRS